MALITKRDTVLTTVPSVIPIKEADENSGAVLASVDGSYDVDIDETRIALRPFFFVDHQTAGNHHITGNPAIRMNRNRFSIFIIISSAVFLEFNISLLPPERMNRCSYCAIGTEKHIISYIDRTSI